MNTFMNTPFFAIGTLGNMEMLVIAALVLVLFGSKKLPTFARSLAQSMNVFKKARAEFEEELHRTIDEAATTPPAAIKPPANTPAPAPVASATVERERDHHEA